MPDTNSRVVSALDPKLRRPYTRAEVEAIRTGDFAQHTRTFHVGCLIMRTLRWLKKGDVQPGHEHNFNHVTEVNRGGLYVYERQFKPGIPPEQKLEYRPQDFILLREYEVWSTDFDEDENGDNRNVRPNMINILWNVHHELIALTDKTRATCIFYNRSEESGLPIDEYNGFEEATGLGLVQSAYRRGQEYYPPKSAMEDELKRIYG